MRKILIGCLILSFVSQIGNNVSASQVANVEISTVRHPGFYVSLSEVATKTFKELTPKNLSSLWQYIPYDKKNTDMDKKFACVRAFVDTTAFLLFLQSNSEDRATFRELTTRVGASGCKLWQTKFWESIKEKQWFDSAKIVSRSFDSSLDLKQLMNDAKSDIQNIQNICKNLKNAIEQDSAYKGAKYIHEDFSVEKLKTYTDSVLASKIYALTRDLYSSMNVKQK